MYNQESGAGSDEIRTQNFSAANRPESLLLQLIGYGIVSGAALAIDAALLYLLVRWAGWHYIVASSVSFIAGAFVAYTLSVHFVFRTRHVENRAIEFSYFLLLGLLGLFVNSAAMSVAVTGFGLGLLQAKFLAAISTFLTNFGLRRRLLFSPARATE